MLEPLVFNETQRCVELIDQTLLPLQLVKVPCYTVTDVAKAITTMQIRGAPAIGVAAAYGLYLGLLDVADDREQIEQRLAASVTQLAATRPTAVNLFWALQRVQNAVLRAVEIAADGAAADAGSRTGAATKTATKAATDRTDMVSRSAAPGGTAAQSPREAAQNTALAAAQALQREDLEMCRAIGKHGAELLRDGETWLTHCNAGALATAGFGTALGVFRAAKEQGRKFRVYVDETRPLLQGSRLTAWELQQDNIDAVLICDNMAGSLMAAGKIHGIVVGADRITATGFVANKIGTYPLAVLAHYHNIPFYIAAPTSTFDLSIGRGSDIVIEQRHPDEVRQVAGVFTAPPDIQVYNPAFDVTPPELISAIFTNLGVLRAPYGQSIRTQVAAATHLESQQ